MLEVAPQNDLLGLLERNSSKFDLSVVSEEGDMSMSVQGSGDVSRNFISKKPSILVDQVDSPNAQLKNALPNK